MVWIEAFVLVLSLVVLARSSSMVVEKAVALSHFFGISQVAIGFILLAVSTSLPEISVSILSSSRAEGAIAAGNVFGSNIANILLILGSGAFLYGFKISKKELPDIALVLLFTTIISAYILFNSSIRNEALGFLEGIILLMVFGAYLVYVLHKKSPSLNGGMNVTKRQALQAFLFFSGGLIIVLVSAGFVVDSAVKLAQEIGVAQSFIGATLIAVGTSLPELAIDLQAIRRRHYGLALGDAVGSNMINLTLALGIAAAINSISVTIPVFIAALLFAIVANALLFYAASVSTKIGRNSGMLFLSIYILYIVVIFYLQLGEIRS